MATANTIDLTNLTDTPKQINQTLATMLLHQANIVERVEAPIDAPEWSQLLGEIGFIPGEQVTVMARGMLGGDPLVVRVGSSTFAIRRAEANCIFVKPAPSSRAAVSL